MAARRPTSRRPEKKEDKFSMDDLRAGTARISLTSWLVTGLPIVRRTTAGAKGSGSGNAGAKGSGNGNNAAAVPTPAAARRRRSQHLRALVEETEELPKERKAGGSPAKNHDDNDGDDNEADHAQSSDMEVETSGSEDYREMLMLKDKSQAAVVGKDEAEVDAEDEVEVSKKDEPEVCKKDEPEVCKKDEPEVCKKDEPEVCKMDEPDIWRKDKSRTCDKHKAKACEKNKPEACEKEPGTTSRVKMKRPKPKDWAAQGEEKAVYVQMMNGKGQVKPVLIRKRTRSKPVVEMLNGAIQHYELSRKSESGYVAESSDTSDTSDTSGTSGSSSTPPPPPPSAKSRKKKKPVSAKKSARVEEDSDASEKKKNKKKKMKKEEEPKKKNPTAKKAGKKEAKSAKDEDSETDTGNDGGSELASADEKTAQTAKQKKKEEEKKKKKEQKKTTAAAQDQPPQGGVGEIPAVGAHDPTTSGADDEGASPGERQKGEQQARRRESTYLGLLRDYYHNQMSGIGASGMPRIEPDRFFTADDCEVLALLHCKRAVEGWQEMQAEFYNMTGRMVDVFLLKAKLGNDGLAYDGGDEEEGEGEGGEKRGSESAGKMNNKKTAKMELEPDRFFTAHDCAVLGELDRKRQACRWLRLQADFFNMTGRMVDRSTLKAKFGQAAQN